MNVYKIIKNGYAHYSFVLTDTNGKVILTGSRKYQMIPLVLNEIELVKKCIKKNLIFENNLENMSRLEIRLNNENKTIIAVSEIYPSKASLIGASEFIKKYYQSVYAIENFETEYLKVYKNSEQIAFISQEKDSDKYFYCFDKTSDKNKKVYSVNSIKEALLQITDLKEISFNNMCLRKKGTESELSKIISEIESNQIELWEDDLSKTHAVVKLSDPWFEKLKNLLKKLENNE